VYARTVKSKELTFQVSGMLWRRSLVMRDVETGSLWSHLLGKCMRGSLVGAELEMFPGTMTTWKEWRSRHPGTKVLGMSRTAKRYAAELWNNPKPYVFGVHLGAGRPSPAVALPELMKASVVNVGAAGHAVVVTWSPDGLGAQAFDRQHGGKTRQFKGAGKGRMTDRATGSTWDAVTGECLDGQAGGTQARSAPRHDFLSQGLENLLPRGADCGIAVTRVTSRD